MLFKPKLTILNKYQKCIWPKFESLKDDFVLYGGTALALRLGHRKSIDFDFFSSNKFTPEEIEKKYDFLMLKKIILQAEPNTYSVSLKLQNSNVKISFFGNLNFGQIMGPQICYDNKLKIASEIDIFAHKLKVIHERSELKDYLDIIAILENGNFKLEEGLSAMQALFPNSINPMITLKALCYFEDGDLRKLTNSEKHFLKEKVIGIKKLPLPPKIQRKIH